MHPFWYPRLILRPSPVTELWSNVESSKQTFIAVDHHRLSCRRPLQLELAAAESAPLYSTVDQAAIIDGDDHGRRCSASAMDGHPRHMEGLGGLIRGLGEHQNGEAASHGVRCCKELDQESPETKIRVGAWEFGSWN
uniref:Uncharacterized protein n=1 Tax=Arundo donax TaxID=35708 RepID=A0A0A9AZN7_ARUDO